jgi:hypothetical protein
MQGKRSRPRYLQYNIEDGSDVTVLILQFQVAVFKLPVARMINAEILVTSACSRDKTSNKISL